MLVDAVGVTDSLKTQAIPLEREHGVAFDKLLEQIASGRSDEDAVSTLAARLARLDRKLGDEAKARVEAVAGRALSALAGVLIEVKRASEVVIDDISRDVVVSSAWDAGAATRMTADFSRFLDEHRDTLTALRILYALPAATRRLTYAGLEELRAAMMRPPGCSSRWRCGARTGGCKVTGCAPIRRGR